VISLLRARWTLASCCALHSSRTARCLCRPAPASSPTAIPPPSSRSASTRQRRSSAPPRKRAASPAPPNAGSNDDPPQSLTPREAASKPLALQQNRAKTTMIVLIDNYDSFTFNLFHYLGGLGADVVVFRNDKISADDVVA